MTISSSSLSSKSPAVVATPINTPHSLLHLHRDLILSILGKLPPKTILQTGLVCKALYLHSRDNIIWRQLFQRTFPLTKTPLSLLEHSLWRHFATHRHLVNAATEFKWYKEDERKELITVHPSNLPQSVFMSTSKPGFNILNHDTDTWTSLPLTQQLIDGLNSLFPNKNLSAALMTKTHLFLSAKNYLAVIDLNTATLISTLELAGEHAQICISPTDPTIFFILTTNASEDGVQLNTYDIRSPDDIKHSKKMMQAECGYLLGSGKHLVCLTWPKTPTDRGHEVTITDLTSNKTLTTRLQNKIAPEKLCMLTNGHLMIVDARRMLYVDTNTMDVHETHASDGRSTTHPVDRIFGQTAGGEVLYHLS